VESETIAPARKMAMYRVVFAKRNRIAGRLGLKVGAIPECPGVGIAGMDMRGG